MKRCSTCSALLLLLGCLASTRTAHSFTPFKHDMVVHHRLSATESNESNDDENDSNHRRNLFRYTLTAATSTIVLPTAPALADAITPIVPTPSFSRDLYWPLGKVAFSLLPLAGGSRRATVEECLVPDKIWTHDQLQGIVNVNVPVRQTVIALDGGGLWVHNPVAPTPQLLKMMRNLEKKHGPVKHIVLGTVALEHKATLGPFAQNFRQATVWIQPGQWSFPLNLPISTLGVLQRGPQLRELLPAAAAAAAAGPANPPPTLSRFQKYTEPPEWLNEIQYEILGPLAFKSVGCFCESAFFHKSTRTLMVTDTVVSVTQTPPLIIQEDPRAMLFHARDNVTDMVEDTPETREKGWRRMVQFGLVFFPSQIDVVPSLGQAYLESRQVDPSRRNLGKDAVPLSLYPWTWHDDNADLRNFEAISRNGTLFCPPILTKLILDREPNRTLAWVDQVCERFPFDRVISSHLNNNIKATPKEFRAAFDVLRQSQQASRGPLGGGGGRSSIVSTSQRPLAEDLALLQKASDLLTKLGVVAPSQVCDGEPARVQGRFARRTVS